MPDQKGDPREFSLSHWLPWTELFRCFQIAFDLRKLLLAALGIVFMYFGWWVLANVFGNFNRPERSNYPISNYENSESKAQDAFDRDERKWLLLNRITNDHKRWPWEEDRPFYGPGNPNNNENPFSVVTTTPNRLASVDFYTRQVPVLLEPLAKFLAPVGVLLSPDSGFASFTFSVLGILWTLAVWAVFGGAIARMAAVQIARKDRISLNEALKFSTAKFISLFSAPLFPAIGVGVIALVVIVVGGILLLIPYFGDLVTGLLFFLPLIAGIIMAALLLGYLGWPLMYATIGAEGSDSFDALSRSYAYIFQRPWHYLFYSLVALLYGVVTILFVVFVTSFFVYMAKWGLSLIPGLGWRATGDPAAALFVYAPQSYGWRGLLLGGWQVPLDNPMSWSQQAAAGFVSFWLHLIFLMMLGYAYSFFWTSFTMVYFLLRKKVDDTEMDEVYLEEEDDHAFATPPVMAATPAPAPTPAPGPTTLPMVTPTPPVEVAKSPTPTPAADGNPPPEAN